MSHHRIEDEGTNKYKRVTFYIPYSLFVLDLSMCSELKSQAKWSIFLRDSICFSLFSFGHVLEWILRDNLVLQDQVDGRVFSHFGKEKARIPSQ